MILSKIKTKLNIFVEQYKNNTQIYEDVFNTLPTNHVRMFTDVEKYAYIIS